MVILSGPSCVGKGPLIAAVRRFYPQIDHTLIPTIKARESRGGQPRPDEESIWNDPDHWRTEDELNNLRDDPRYLVGYCRDSPQAVDLERIRQAPSRLVIVEVYHTIGMRLCSAAFLKGIEIVTVFITPMSAEEIVFLKQCGISPAVTLRGLMVLKQYRRLLYHRREIDDEIIHDIEARARDAVAELRSAPDYTLVVVNHDGEGSPSWNRLPTGRFTSSPIGEAKRTLDAFVEVLKGETPASTEIWQPGII